MPLEQTQNEIRARVKMPGAFEEGSFKSKDISDGIRIIVGKLKGETTTTTQSYRFRKPKWDISKVKSWLNEKNVKVLSIDGQVIEEMTDGQEVECFETLKDVEIFATGKWNGKEFGIKDLDDMVDSFKSLGDKIKPFLKLGHNKTQKLAKDSGLGEDGMPSLGWVESLKREGDKLVATFKDVPRVIKDLIDKGAYKRISSEIFMNFRATKEEAGVESVFPRVLRAVALLGADTPAVTTLQDVAALYGSDQDYETYEFAKEDFTEKEEEMSEEIKEVIKKKEIKEEVKADYSKKVKEAEEIVAMFSDVEDIKSYINDLKAKEESLKEKELKYTKLIEESKDKEVAEFTKGLLDNNQILPAQEELVSKLLKYSLDAEECLEFTQTEYFGLKEKMSIEDSLKAFLSNLPKNEILEEFSSTKKEEVIEDVDSYVKEIMKEESCNYEKAQNIAFSRKPELFELNLEKKEIS